jgi:hypothetical protein
MGIVRRIEGAAEQSDSHPGCVQGQRDTRRQHHASRVRRAVASADAGTRGHGAGQAQGSAIVGPGARGLRPPGRDDSALLTA